jgi:hypothetical protein
VRVIFNKKLTQRQYDSLVPHDEGTVYFVQDTRKIYVGDTEFIANPQREGIPVEFERELSRDHKIRRVQSEDGGYFKLSFFDVIRDPEAADPILRQWQSTLLHTFEFTADGWITIDGVPILDRNAAVMVDGDIKINDTKTFTYDIQVPNLPKTNKSAVNKKWVTARYDDDLYDTRVALPTKADNYYPDEATVPINALVRGSIVKKLSIGDLPTFLPAPVNRTLTLTTHSSTTYSGDSKTTLTASGTTIVIASPEVVRTLYSGGTWEDGWTDATIGEWNSSTHELTLYSRLYSTTCTIEAGVDVTIAAVNSNKIDPEFNYKYITQLNSELNAKIDNVKPMRLIDRVDYYGSRADIESLSGATNGKRAVSSSGELGTYSSGAWTWTPITGLSTGFVYKVGQFVNTGALSSGRSGSVTYLTNSFHIDWDEKLIADNYTLYANASEQVSVLRTPGVLSVAGLDQTFNGSTNVELTIPRVHDVSFSEESGRSQLRYKDGANTEKAIDLPIVQPGVPNQYAGVFSTPDLLPDLITNPAITAGTIAKVESTQTEWIAQEDRSWLDTHKPIGSSETYKGGVAGILTGSMYADLLGRITPSTMFKTLNLTGQVNGERRTFDCGTVQIAPNFYVLLNGVELIQGLHYQYNIDNSITILRPNDAPVPSGSTLAVKFFPSLSVTGGSGGQDVTTDVKLQSGTSGDNVIVTQSVNDIITSTIVLEPVSDKPGVVSAAQKKSWDSKADSLPQDALSSEEYVLKTTGWAIATSIDIDDAKTIATRAARQCMPDNYVRRGITVEMLAESALGFGGFEEGGTSWVNLIDGNSVSTAPATFEGAYLKHTVGTGVKLSKPLPSQSTLDVVFEVADSASSPLIFSTLMATGGYQLYVASNGKLYFRGFTGQGEAHVQAHSSAIKLQQPNTMTFLIRSEGFQVYLNGEASTIRARTFLPSALPITLVEGAAAKLYAVRLYSVTSLDDAEVKQNQLNDNIRYGLRLPYAAFA